MFILFLVRSCPQRSTIIRVCCFAAQVLDLLGEISMDSRKELEAAVKHEADKDKAQADAKAKA